MDQLEATTWSKIDNSAFHKMFGFYSVAFIGSILANYIAQSLQDYRINTQQAYKLKRMLELLQTL